MAGEAKDETRLWIGHLDHRITEFQLLKILQKFGEIEKFDMLFHRSGPLNGQPRGYAFVTYKKAEDALRALNKLDGQKIGIKYCSIRFAKNVNYDDMMERPKPRIEIPALAAGGSKDGGAPASISRRSCIGPGNRKTDSAIQAIEAKLKMLENKRSGDEFLVNSRTVASYQEAPIQNYQFNLNDPQAEKYSSSHHHKRPHRHPYNSRPPHHNRR